jgi:hypothetical protein
MQTTPNNLGLIVNQDLNAMFESCVISIHGMNSALDKSLPKHLNLSARPTIIHFYWRYLMKTFNGDQKIKLTQIINEGMQVMHEVDTLSAGLNDTIKAIAEELEIKPAVLKKAIKLAHKAEFGKAKQDHEQLETILETVGKTL